MNTNEHEKRRRMLVALLYSFVSVLGLSGVAHADAPHGRDLLAAASDRAVIVARSEATDVGDHTIILSRHLGGDAHWHRLLATGHRVVGLSARGDDAIVLLDNGTWLTVWEDGSPMGPLPKDADVVALAADPSLDHYTLWAVAVAHAPTTGPTTFLATAPTTGPATLAATVPATTSPATMPVVLGPGLFRLLGSQWEYVAGLPPDIAPLDASHIRLKILAGQPVLTTVIGEKVLQSWSYSEAKWTTLAPVTAGAPVRDFNLLDAGLPPTLWFTTGGPGVLASIAGSQHVLAKESGAKDAPADADPSAIARAAETLRVYSLSDNHLYEQAYNADGSTMGDRGEIVAQIPLTDSQWQSWLAPLVTVGFTMIVLGAFRGTPEINPEVLEKAGVELAPMGTRFLAGAIDAAPVIASILWLLYGMSQQANYHEAPPLRLVLPFYITLVLYLAYTTTAELLRHQTLGKWYCGLRIVNVQGQTPDPGAIIMRNLLRLIDVTLLFAPLALILFSPLQQRLGDVAAGTIVVQPLSESDSRSSEH